MSDEPKREGGRAWIVAGLVLMPVLYVLSYGPVVAAWAAGYLPFPVIAFVYAPLTWLGGRSPGFADALTSYVGLWLP
jgi:hypothetical protein